MHMSKTMTTRHPSLSRVLLENGLALPCKEGGPALAALPLLDCKPLILQRHVIPAMLLVSDKYTLMLCDTHACTKAWCDNPMLKKGHRLTTQR